MDNNAPANNTMVHDGHFDQNPVDYSTVPYGYSCTPGEMDQNQGNHIPYVMPSYPIDGMSQSYVDGTDRIYQQGYAVQDRNLPMNHAMGGYLPQNCQIMPSYDNYVPLGNPPYGQRVEYYDAFRGSNMAHMNGKSLHRQKKNFLCC